MSVQATIGSWYFADDVAQRFEVVAVDDASKLIEIQYFDGSVGELDSDAWEDLQIVNCADPGDWSGPYDLDGEFIDDTDESSYMDTHFDELAIEGLHIFDDNSFEETAGIWA